jgi:hypothetical protein
VKRALALAALLVALAGCDTVANGGSVGGTGTPARNGSMEDTTRDAENLTEWCLNNGLCSAPQAIPFETTTTVKGNSW